MMLELPYETGRVTEHLTSFNSVSTLQVRMGIIMKFYSANALELIIQVLMTFTVGLRTS